MVSLREIFQRELEAALAGDPVAAAQVREGWKPIIDQAKDGGNVGRKEEYDHDQEGGRDRWKIASERR